VQVLESLVYVFSSLILYKPTPTYSWVEKVQLVPLQFMRNVCVCVCVCVFVSYSNYSYYFVYIDRPIHV
jgi:hypothetical protein